MINDILLFFFFIPPLLHTYFILSFSLLQWFVCLFLLLLSSYVFISNWMNWKINQSCLIIMSFGDIREWCSSYLFKIHSVPKICCSCIGYDILFIYIVHRFNVDAIKKYIYIYFKSNLCLCFGNAYYKINIGCHLLVGNRIQSYRR